MLKDILWKLTQLVIVCLMHRYFVRLLKQWCLPECLLRNYCEKEKKIWSCLLLLYLVMSWKMLYCMKLVVNRGIFIYVELSPLCIYFPYGMFI